eukprot:m51a1_g9832 hypothetical protein (617) ;mRNA; r:1928990-1931607
MSAGKGRWEGGDLSRCTSLFRNKLVEEYRLLEGGAVAPSDAPIYTAGDLEGSGGSDTLRRALRENPKQLVKFTSFRRDPLARAPSVAARPAAPRPPDDEARAAAAAKTDIRLRRARNTLRLPVGVWARSVVNHRATQTLVHVLIVANAALLGVEADRGRSAAVDVVDSVSLVVYSLEVALRMLDAPRAFYRDAWNVFDLCVTATTVVAAALGASGAFSSAASLVRTLRLARLVRGYRALEVIFETVARTFRALAYVLLLLAVVAFAYAVFFVHYMRDYTSSASALYAWKWSGFAEAAATLFQLMTLDHWYSLHEDGSRAVGGAAATAAFLTWIVVAAFVFRNILIGTTVNTYQSVSKASRDAARAARATAALPAAALAGASTGGAGRAAGGAARRTQYMGTGALGRVVDEAGGDAFRWHEGVVRHCARVAALKAETLWPRDTLFEYLQTMEALQENVAEAQQLNALAARVVHQAFDTLQLPCLASRQQQQQQQQQWPCDKGCNAAAAASAPAPVVTASKTVSAPLIHRAASLQHGAPHKHLRRGSSAPALLALTAVAGEARATAAAAAAQRCSGGRAMAFPAVPLVPTADFQTAYWDAASEANATTPRSIPLGSMP